MIAALHPTLARHGDRARRGALLLAMGLAGCAPAIAPQPAVTRAPPPPGLERLMGQPAAVAIGLLGRPSLDRREGPGQHLQFVRAGCILDIYVYPAPPGPPAARFAEARTPDGKPLPAGECFARQLAARLPA